MAVDRVLPAFQEFLRTGRIVPDNQIPYYARWASNHLTVLNKNSFANTDLTLIDFIDTLNESGQFQD